MSLETRPDFGSLNLVLNVHRKHHHRMTTPLHVLILEDRESDAELLLYELRLAGFEPVGARVVTGHEYQAALDPALDLILADYNLPQFDGLRALHLLRERGLDIPFILVSGTVGEDLAVTAMKEGASDYLLKDRLARLGPAVIRALEQKRLRDEKRRAEQALRESEERFRALVEHASDAIALIAADGSIIYESPSASGILGYAHGELIGRSAFELLHPDDLPYISRLFSELLQKPGASVTTQYRNRHRDGSWRWIEGTGTNLLAEPGVQAIVANYHDITERKQHERELESIISVANAMRTGPTRAEMAPVILDQVLNLLSADSAALAMRDPISGETVIELARGDWFKRSGERLAPGEGVTGRVIATGQWYRNTDFHSDARFHRSDLNGDPGDVACVPLIAQKHAIGALAIARKSEITAVEVHLLMAIGDIAANALHRSTLHEQINQRVERLAALRTVDSAITASFDLRLTLNIVLDELTSQLRVAAADILLLNSHTQTLECVAGRGFPAKVIERLRLPLGEGYAGRVALERRAITVPDLMEHPHEFVHGPLVPAQALRSYHAVPLIVKGQVKGVLEIFLGEALTAEPEWFDFLETLAGQAAIAIDNAELFDNLQRSNFELVMAYDTTLEGWSRALDLRDKETEGHSQRVANITVQLARAMGVSEAKIVHLRRGALLHDIGKMGIPDGILLKPGPLSAEEWEIMRRHPTYAFEFLSPVAFLRPALDIPYYHHEKWDGTGYPHGLKAEQIPLAARIFAVADVWDALRSDRPYRAAWLEEKVHAHVKSLAGTHFDRQVVEVFLRIIGAE